MANDYLDRIVREAERKLITQVSRTTAWKWEQLGLFPKRIKLGNRSIGWSLLEINAWLLQRRETRNLMDTSLTSVRLDEVI